MKMKRFYSTLTLAIALSLGSGMLSPTVMASQNNAATSAEEIFLSETTLEEASKQFGYQVKLPKYLPQNMTLAYQYYKSGEYDYESVSVYNMLGGALFLDITLTKGDAKKAASNSIPGSLSEKKIGKTTFYLSKQKGSSFLEPERTEWNRITWQEDEGIVYSIVSSLQYEEMIKIAQSVE